MTDTPKLEKRGTGGGRVVDLDPAAAQPGNSWRLSIPPGLPGVYRWAQLDDYLDLPRDKFSWQPPLRISLSARVSALDLPGTWGFGLWNDPFSLNFPLPFLQAQANMGTARRWPALPNTAWFFHGSPPNHLSLRDDIPADGFFAGTFQSGQLPTGLYLFGIPFLPLLLWPIAARGLRRLARGFIRQAGHRVETDPRQWHTYTIDWQSGQVVFLVDGQVILSTPLAPRAPLGLVVWIDNQYASLGPDGKFGYGTLANPEEAWLEIKDLQVL